jgi:hypothetical protein
MVSDFINIDYFDKLMAEQRPQIIDQLCARLVMGWRLATHANDLVGYDKPATGDYVLSGDEPLGQPMILQFSSGPDAFVQTWSPASDWNTAFTLVKEVKKLIFSRRARFWSHVKVVTAEGQEVAWPCALLYLTPMHIAKAAILASVPESGQVPIYNSLYTNMDP